MKLEGRRECFGAMWGAHSPNLTMQRRPSRTPPFRTPVLSGQLIELIELSLEVSLLVSFEFEEFAGELGFLKLSECSPPNGTRAQGLRPPGESRQMVVKDVP